MSHIPHILMGASSSSRMGWLIKISLAFVHRYFISYSCSCTGFPGRLPRTELARYRVSDGAGRRHDEGTRRTAHLPKAGR